MTHSPKIKEHDDISQRKDTKAIPFQWKTILCSATGYYNKSKKCFVVEVHTANPAGGRRLKSQCKTTLKGRAEIPDFLASEESVPVKERLYKKYAEKQVEMFPGDPVQRSAADAYTLLEETQEFQSYLAREIGKGRKNPSNTQDTLDRDLLDKYLSFYGDRPLCRIDKGVRKTVEQDLAAQDPRFTKHQMQRCRHRLEWMQWYAADHGWMNMPKRWGRKRYDAKGQKRNKLGNQSLSCEECGRLLELAKQESLQDGRAVGVLLMLLEGLLPEEVCGLQYEDYVRLPDSVYYNLRVLRPYVEENGNILQFGREKDAEKILINEEDADLEEGAGACEENLTAYALRHTYCTGLSIAADLTDEEMAYCMGHQSPTGSRLRMNEDKQRRLLLAHEAYEAAFAGEMVPPEPVCGDDVKEDAS